MSCGVPLGTLLAYLIRETAPVQLQQTDKNVKSLTEESTSANSV